ncbi:hypothetical protein [Escherichia coli]|uniref:hypothetical protein n=1 Tax=Escherichia coli TaxID=562 RepID=UPI003F8BD862
MLTGPVTMLQWSFVRDDQPRAQTARQLALAIRDREVCYVLKARRAVREALDYVDRSGLN